MAWSHLGWRASHGSSVARRLSYEQPKFSCPWLMECMIAVVEIVVTLGLSLQLFVISMIAVVEIVVTLGLSLQLFVYKHDIHS